MPSKLVRRRVVIKVRDMAGMLDISREELAKRWGVTDKEVRYYINGSLVPRVNVFEKILATKAEFVKLIRNKKALLNR